MIVRQIVRLRVRLRRVHKAEFSTARDYVWCGN